MEPIIYFASDHAGFELKNELVNFVRNQLGYQVIDCGAQTYDEGDDFTDFISKAAREVSVNPKNAKGIILGGSGQGEAMLANRFQGVRAVVYYGGAKEIVTLSRAHNDANVLSLGARFLNVDEAKDAVSSWLETKHIPVEKYDRRIKEIEDFSPAQTPESLKKNVTHSVVPSLPAQSFSQIETLFDSLRGVSLGFQIDIVDGQFVPAISWPFTEIDIAYELQKLAKYTNEFDLEIDCMCMSPEKYLDLFVKLGVKRVVVHAGSTEKLSECIAHARVHSYKIGLGILNTTSLSFLESYSKDIDFIQVMGIADIGKQGEPFDESTLVTVSELRLKYPNLEIAVDGAVNEETILKLLKAGVNRFAPGSAISKADNPADSYKQLARMVGL